LTCDILSEAAKYDGIIPVSPDGGKGNCPFSGATLEVKK
jgi:hypothetical protein